MPTYYKTLKIHPTASQAEIEAAIDAQYNKWRRLVTHHNPDTVDKANRTLRRLETVRTTLTDPVKRAAYDTQIGIGSTMGGLTDPTAAPTPPKPARATGTELDLSLLRKSRAYGSPPKPSEATGKRLDAWLCQSCHTANPVETKFCTKCGQTVGQNCPKCRRIIDVTAQFCPHCGVDVEATRRQQEAEKAAFLAREREENRRRTEAKARAEAKEKQAQRRSTIGCGVFLVILAFSCWAGYGWFTYKWGVDHITMRPGEEHRVGEYRVYAYIPESVKATCDGGGFPFGFMVESPRSDIWSWGYYYSITGSTQVVGDRLYSNHFTFSKNTTTSIIKDHWANFYMNAWGKHTDDRGINGFGFCDFQTSGYTGVEILLSGERTVVSWQVR